MKKLIICAICAICGFTTANAQAKFGHVNTQEIIQAMPEYTTAKAEIDKLTAQYEADLKAMQDELQKKADDFQKEQANMLENLRARREQELNDLYQRYQQSVADNQQAYQKAYAEKMQAISEKITAAVKQIGEAGGYVYIMDVTSGIPYISTKLSTDITPELKKALGI